MDQIKTTKKQPKEVSLAVIPVKTELYRFLSYIIRIMQKIYDDYDNISDTGLKALADAINSIGYLPRKTMVNEHSVKELTDDLKQLRDEIKPILRHLLVIAKETLNFASGKKKIPFDIAKLLVNFMQSNPELIHSLYENIT